MNTHTYIYKLSAKVFDHSQKFVCLIVKVIFNGTS